MQVKVREAVEPQGEDPIHDTGPVHPGPHRAVSTSACAARPDRKALRRNHSAPAGLRRGRRAGHATAQRADHAAARRAEPAGARAFATTAIRILLEVLDRRRPVAQLNALCAPGLVCAVGSLVAGDHAPGRTLGSAVLGPVRLLQVEERGAELMATYQRGSRRFVVAGRIERGPTTPWKMTALRVM
ncbi:Rv3235 family protein [Nocardia sp. NPDC003963]